MSAPRLYSPSFAKGELTPLIWPRYDIQAYGIGLELLKNMIVLPTGGVTRRPGFVRAGAAHDSTPYGDDSPARLIRFVCSHDAAYIAEFTHRRIDIWEPRTHTVVATITSSPYERQHLKGIKHAQSGNYLFLANREVAPHILKRQVTDSGVTFSLEPLDYKEGPWMSDLSDTGTTIQITRFARPSTVTLTASAPTFDASMVGRLIKLNFTVPRRDIDSYEQNGPSEWISEKVEIGGQYHIQTHDNWHGWVVLERSYDGGVSWVDAIPRYTRTDAGAQGNWDMSRSEEEPNVLYRFRSARTDNGAPIRFTLTVSGFTKMHVVKITSVASATTATGIWQRSREEVQSAPTMYQATTDWDLGAWGNSQTTGWPGAISFYQDRLVLGGSAGSPQTIWMSKIGDYANFGTSSPIADDDAINVTLTSDAMDGIQAFASLGDLVIFTTTDEWRISGSGENGAITPTSITAHRQATDIGSSHIQPMLVGGAVIFVQTHRTQVHSIGFDLSTDGYTGGEISVFSSHLFEWRDSRNGAARSRRIKAAAWQKVPDRLIWFALDDGSAVTCTFQQDQQICAWARHETDGAITDVCSVPHPDGYDELWAVIRRGSAWNVSYMRARAAERDYTDHGVAYESALRTMRVNWQAAEGSIYGAKKCVPRVSVFTVQSEGANVAPEGDRRRSVKLDAKWDSKLHRAEVQVNGGYSEGSQIEIWTTKGPLTITAIAPSAQSGGWT